MTTLTIHPATDDQETAIRMFLDDLHVDYKADKITDDTSYLLSSPANAEHLEKSINQGNAGQVTALGLEDVFQASGIAKLQVHLTC